MVRAIARDLVEGKDSIRHHVCVVRGHSTRRTPFQIRSSLQDAVIDSASSGERDLKVIRLRFIYPGQSSCVNDAQSNHLKPNQSFGSANCMRLNNSTYV